MLLGFKFQLLLRKDLFFQIYPTPKFIHKPTLHLDRQRVKS
jgi:hypothetical protein